MDIYIKARLAINKSITLNKDISGGRISTVIYTRPKVGTLLKTLIEDLKQGKIIVSFPRYNEGNYPFEIRKQKGDTSTFEILASGNIIVSAESTSGTYQEVLVSGVNIKTINGDSVLGSGDLTVGGGFDGTMDDIPNGSTYVKTHNDFTDAKDSKLAGIAAGAEVNVQADWNQASSGSDDYIKNKPTIPVVSDLAYGAGWDGNTDAPSKNSVYDKIETLVGVSFFPGTMTVTYGTLDTGVVGDLAAVGGTDVNVSEAAGENALQVDLTFTGVTRMDSIVIYGHYKGGSSHHIDVSIKRASSSVYDIIGAFGSSTDKQWYSFNIFNATTYNNSGTVIIRLNHPDTGNVTHDLIIDYVEVRSGIGGAGTTLSNASAVSFIPSGNIASTNVQEALEELDSEKTTLAAVLAAVYPVGAIYTSVVNTSPATLFGGTWSAFGAGRVLVGLDAGDTDFDTVEETGGSKTVQSSAQTFAGNALGTHQHAAISAGTPAGTISGIAISDHSSHTHTITQSAFGTTRPGSAVGSCYNSGGIVSSPSGGPSATLSHNVSNNGTFTGTALGTHQHDAISAGTPSGSNTPGAATSVVQPYIVVYMWKRTA